MKKLHQFGVIRKDEFLQSFRVAEQPAFVPEIISNPDTIRFARFFKANSKAFFIQVGIDAVEIVDPIRLLYQGYIHGKVAHALP